MSAWSAWSEDPDLTAARGYDAPTEQLWDYEYPATAPTVVVVPLSDRSRIAAAIPGSRPAGRGLVVSRAGLRLGAGAVYVRRVLLPVTGLDVAGHDHPRWHPGVGGGHGHRHALRRHPRWAGRRLRW
jgi:hypothetical protein